MIGRTLSHYEIVGHLGGGGMGEVYLARDTKLERLVALKVLPAEVAGDPVRLGRFRREAKALAALDHPGIVTVFSVEEADGIHFFTMTHVEGRTLDGLIPPEGMPTERLLKLGKALAEALQAAHERGIVHRDLKPGNIMVDEEGRLRVLDFGLARVEESVPLSSQMATLTMEAPMTGRGMVLGTVPYMSPEQVQGRPVDHRTDIFSLGILLYEMACWKRPFRGDDSASLISSILRDEPEPLAKLRPGLPQRLVDTIERCLAKKREDRFPTAREVHEQLVALRSEVTAGRAEVTRHWPKAARLGIGARVVLATALILAMVAGVFWFSSRGPGESTEVTAQRISSLAVLPLANLSGSQEQEYFSDGMTEALITDLSKIGALTVIARSSAMRYKESGMSPAEIASELGVDALVGGSVQREHDRVRISVQLIEAATERNLWADRYERHLTSVLALQAEVAQAIAREIRIKVTPGERDLLAVAPEVDPEAYDAYLQGRFHVTRLKPGDLDKALRYFELALEKDPDYAPAHAGVAAVWVVRGQFRIALPAEAQPKARAAAARAVELDERLGEAHYVLALIRTWIEWDWEGAEVAFRRAIELQPSFADVRGYYAHYLMIMRRPLEAAAEMERALELDPVNPLMRALHGVLLTLERRYEEAGEVFRGILTTHPRQPLALSWLSEIHQQRGEFEKSYELYREWLLVMKGVEAARAWERGYSEGGLVKAHDRLAEWKRPRLTTLDYCPVGMAGDLVGAGRHEEALDCLELAYKGRDQNMPYTGLGPMLVPLRDEPRFREIMVRMGLPSDPLPAYPK